MTVSEKRVPRRIFGPNRDEIIGGWRKLYNYEPRNLYSSPDMIRIVKSRRMRWAGYVARMGEKMNAYRVLVGSPEGNRLLGRHRCRWGYIKMDFRGIRWVVWTGFIRLWVETSGGFTRTR
jgi:hypothetical protein